MVEFKTYLAKEFGVSEEEWAIITAHFEEIKFPKNEPFIQEGRICRRTGFILEGVMRYFDRDKEGNEPTCYFTYEGHYITDPFTYSEQKPSVINLTSITDCRLAAISYENDKKLTVAFPRWKEITTTMLLRISVEFADTKTMMALSAADRYAYFINKYPNLALRVPLQYVASYLGIAQPSLSRLRKGMAKSR